MKDNKKSRALGLFSAMSQLPEGYVTAAEEELYAIEAGLRRPPKSQNAFTRFAHNGWCAAAVSGIVALAVLALIIRAGSGPAPIVPPVGGTPSSGELESTAPEGDVSLLDAADFTISTDKQTYVEGITSFNVSLTGKTPGKDISLPGEWHLYQVVDGERVPVVGMYYTGEEMRGIAPDANTCATLTKTIFINPHNSSNGLAPGRYIIGAHVETDSEIASVECAFEVIARDGGTDPDGTTPDGDDHHGDSATPNDPPADEVEIVGDNARINFTLSTDSRHYLEGITSFVVKLTGKNPGEEISLPGEWHLYRVTQDGREPIVGMYYTDEELRGLAPNENTRATLNKTIFINPHNTSGGMAVGTYVLCACVETESGTETVECAFEVVSQTAALGADDRYHVDPVRCNVFYITSDVIYECLYGGSCRCAEDKVSAICVPPEVPDCHDACTFHDYITSDGRVYRLVDRTRT